MDCGCGHCKKDESEQCMHAYSEHLKRLQGGDYTNSSLRDEHLGLKYTGNELTAFLDIGAEAERRNDMIVNDMKYVLEKCIKENNILRNDNCSKIEQLRELQRKVADNENIILSLTFELDQMNRDMNQNSELKCQVDQLEREKECLFQENDDLNSKITELSWKFTKLQEVHKQCPTKEDLKCKEQKISQLNSKLAELEKKLKNESSMIALLKEENSAFENELTKLTMQYKSQSEQFADKSCSYQKTISNLKNRISCLEKILNNVENDKPNEKLIYESTVDQLPKISETYISKQIYEQDRIMQQLINTIGQRDKNIQQLSKIQDATNGITEEEYIKLTKIIEEQANEISQLNYELQNKSLEDSESVELLNEISQLQYAVYDSAGDCHNDGVYPLLRKIKRIRCRIKSRLQREEARRKEIARQLGLYRCQFIHIQKEIEELRLKGGDTSNKDEIKVRVEQENILSQYICQANKQKRELQSKCESLKKALTNIDKVNEFVMHLPG